MLMFSSQLLAISLNSGDKTNLYDTDKGNHCRLIK
jgi:hypothetical protein